MPPADPDFLRRVRRLRWEKGAVAAALTTAWATWLGLMFFIRGFIFLNFLHIFMGSGTAAAWLWARGRRASPDVADLLDLPASFPQFPVELSYRVQHHSYGRDEGIISFAGGWMHFQGRRTSWSLRESDVAPPAPEEPRLFFAPRSILQNIEWRDGDKIFGILILPMDGANGLGKGLRKRFAQALDDWKVDSLTPEGSAVLPPVRAMDDLAERVASGVRTWRALGWVTGAALLAAVAGAIGIGWTSAWVGVVLALLSAWLVAISLATLQAAKLSALLREGLAGSEYLSRRPAPGWQAGIARKLRQRALGARRGCRDLAVSRPNFESAEMVPVELRYEIRRRGLPTHEYRREAGWLSVNGGRVRFHGRFGGWSVGRDLAVHRDASEASWRALFQRPLPFEHTLELSRPEKTIAVRIFPLAFRGQRHAADRLARQLEEFDRSDAHTPGESVLPFGAPEPHHVRALERGLVRWSVIRLLCVPLFLVDLAVANLTGLKDLPTAVMVLCAAIPPIFVCLYAESARNAFNSKLGVVELLCDGGEDLVRYRQGVGPWWLRRGKA